MGILSTAHFLTSPFCFPVYSGRVPELMIKRMDSLKGENTPSAVVCTYGCREYDDAIMEMKDFSESRGFKTIGAMAVVAEHSVVTSVGKGRPDINDENVIDVFAKEVREKLLSAASINQFSELFVPGNPRYRKYIHVPMAPSTLESCNKCAACVKLCPAGAITLTDSGVHTDKSLCIGCVRCVRSCPQKARKVGKMKDTAAKLILEIKKKHKTSEIFL